MIHLFLVFVPALVVAALDLVFIPTFVATALDLVFILAFVAVDALDLVFVPAQVAGFRGSIVRSNLVAIKLNIKL